MMRKEKMAQFVVILMLLTLTVMKLILGQSAYPIGIGKRGTYYVVPDVVLEMLTYDVEEIPGWIASPPPKNRAHTFTRLEVGNVGLKPSPGVRGQIIRFWRNLKQKYQTVEIDIRVYDRPAKKYGETLSEYRRQSQFGPRIKAGTPSGFPLGEESWYLAPGTVFFRLNQCAVLVHAPDLAFAEALAWGIEYRFHQQSEILSLVQKPLTVLVSAQPVARGKAISLAGVTVAPISAFEPAQVSIETNKTEKEWTVTVSRKGRWVRLKAFSWEMETNKGKVKLVRPVFPYKYKGKVNSKKPVFVSESELIVPLRQVAEALGIVVQQKGQTIALSPR